MTELPKMPQPSRSAYPLGYIEDAVSRVDHTDAQAYLDKIKELVADIDSYIACLRHKGFEIDGNILKPGFQAIKQTIIK
jgi:hypothetical protein